MIEADNFKQYLLGSDVLTKEKISNYFKELNKLGLTNIAFKDIIEVTVETIEDDLLYNDIVYTPEGAEFFRINTNKVLFLKRMLGKSYIF